VRPGGKPDLACKPQNGFRSLLSKNRAKSSKNGEYGEKFAEFRRIGEKQEENT
jgi:hypothetical protein